VERSSVHGTHSFSAYKELQAALAEPAADCYTKSMTFRRRADLLLVERGLFESRAKAQAAIAAGLVMADEKRIAKASEVIPVDCALRATAAHPYVSRGGVKLAAALEHFQFDPRNRVCLDVGASTGGFTDALLQRGARCVYAVDVGRDQLHPSLRANSKVVSIEATDIRKLDRTLLHELPDLIVVDVSFISLKVVLAAALALARPPAHLVALIKPQFEAGRRYIKKGIVRDADIHVAVCNDVKTSVELLGWHPIDVIASPVLGGDGNREFLLGAACG
jgi:23S rRNA (cytidine1920-2'-O)/16S rRNA (cytidine1409-2'-O)-methyltransferase